jgi:hypothetical protein
MITISRLFVTAVATAGLAVAFTGDVAAQAAKKGAKTCVNKAGEGTGGNTDSAKFQAWEAVLQATDWGSWAAFMSGGAKIGTAPGYAVSKVGSSCRDGGLGKVCRMQATLCK